MNTPTERTPVDCVKQTPLNASDHYLLNQNQDHHIHIHEHEHDDHHDQYGDDEDITVNKLGIKSKAVVKYGIFNHPLQFLQLHANTNLNKAPSNWLRCSSPLERYIRQATKPKQQRSQFASFLMANEDLDAVGEMDVISDSENIKNLMRMPYCKSQPISMMVHRIGKTLFLDGFDIQKHLLRQQEEDWKWLRKFYYETVLRNVDDAVPRQVKGRHVLQDRNMFSKFLYYSVESNKAEAREMKNSESFGNTADTTPATSVEERDMASKLHGNSCNEFSRTVQWTFEDIRMLIGTDLPIFGGGTHPCVSLRLREMHQPINVLTGLDYWLDNLMCNVPELAMCYHLNGIVQNYELVSTNDIPSMDNSKFSPSVIRDVAQNILSFLKTNVTKEGHTYWLFKGLNDDVIKLYDLSTLCADSSENNGENPFTVPVGILLFRVARNIMNSYGRDKSATVRTLLKNCLTLLDPTKHAQVVTEACFMLADLYIKDDIHDQDLPKVSDEEDSDEDEVIVDRSENRTEISMTVNSLCVPETRPNGYLDVVDYAPISAHIEDRCTEALKSIAQGLLCLEKSIESNANDREQVMCDRAIPLRYEKLSQSPSPPTADDGDGDGAVASESNDVGRHDVQRLTSDAANESCSDCATSRSRIPPQLPVSPVRSRPEKSWQTHCKLSLLEKSVFVYYWLADVRAKCYKYGSALRCLRHALVCYNSIWATKPVHTPEAGRVHAALMTMVGDVHMMLAREAEIGLHADMYSLGAQDDDVIMEWALANMSNTDPGQIAMFTHTPVENLTRATDAYRLVVELQAEAALDGSDQTTSAALRRYGSSQNELGVCHMNILAKTFATNADESNLTEAHDCEWKKCLTYFNSAISLFENIDDRVNKGLVCSNKARLWRLLARGSVEFVGGERTGFSQTERHYFTKAIDSYRDTLRVLGSRHSCAHVWDSVVWELSSTYFNLATTLQDYPPLHTHSQDQVEQDVTLAMNKALKYCDVDQATSRLSTCQYRAATIHHRLASLYHNALRNQTVEQKKRHLRMLADLHYDKACRFFQILESPCELLRVTLERVALCEFLMAAQNSSASKLKTARQALSFLLQCLTPMTMIVEQARDTTSGFEAYIEETQKLMTIFASRLQFTLLSMVKVCSNVKKGKGVDSPVVSTLKQMYALSLGQTTDTTSGHTVDTIAKQAEAFVRLLKSVHTSWTQIEPSVSVSD